jgi:hypothetical protein
MTPLTAEDYTANYSEIDTDPSGSARQQLHPKVIVESIPGE